MAGTAEHVETGVRDASRQDTRVDEWNDGIPVPGQHECRLALQLALKTYIAQDLNARRDWFESPSSRRYPSCSGQ